MNKMLRDMEGRKEIVQHISSRNSRRIRIEKFRKRQYLKI